MIPSLDDGKSHQYVKNQILIYLAREAGGSYKKQESYNSRQISKLFCKKLGLNIDERLIQTEVLARKFNKLLLLSNFDFDVAVQAARELYVKWMSRKQERLLKKSSKTIVYKEHANVIGNLPGSIFYQTTEWRSLRYKVLSKRGNQCECCGRGPRDGTKVHVDHIKPRSFYPELALLEENMQVLCEDCNMGKSNQYEDDWRGS